MSLNVVPLSPEGFASTSYFLFAAIVVFIALCIVALALKYKKIRMPLAIAIGVLLIVVASAYLVWSNVASINYWINSNNTYPAAGNNNLTIKCVNNGHMAGTFNLKITFAKATISKQTSQPYELIDNRTAVFTYTLQSEETQSSLVHFTIDSNVTDFYVSLAFQQNGINFFVKSDRGGVSEESYQKDPDTGIFERRVYYPPP